MRRIINDYAEYHAAIVIAGGLFTLILVLFSIVFWIKLKETSKTGKFKWTFEEKVYFSFGLLSSTVALLMAFIVAVNATNAVDPIHGFSLLIDSLTPSSSSAQLHHVYNDWIQSGSKTPPTLIKQHIHRRVVFHTTKAIICSTLTIVFMGLSLHLWSTLIRRRKASKTIWKLKEKTFLVTGMATVAFSLLMTIAVVANLQGAVAPITLTLLLG
ncbi:MAG: hypothetical protein DCF15_20420 [Phormidesmis priestleyi]|uniref:Uncharacterized protein n=1 Tax=Phormidesmis priestleyi TaxID=268141 RepID=A0A2W4WN64_9CYAN|nr:MAG: hypothetical protein DCF15_20420 [Phormidesmis priestleyi]